jgi:hypothetical protein
MATKVKESFVKMEMKFYEKGTGDKERLLPSLVPRPFVPLQSE